MLQKLKITSSIALVALFLLVTPHQSNASTQSQQSNTPTNFKHDYLPNYTVNSIDSEHTGVKLARSWGHYKSKRKHYCERKRRGRYSQSRYCRSYRARHAAKARARYKERKRKRWERFKRSRKSSSSRARTTSNRGGAAAKARIAQLEKDLAASRSKEQAMASAARELTASKARIAQLEKDLAASRSKEQAMANAARELTASKARIAQLEKDLAASRSKEQKLAHAAINANQVIQLKAEIVQLKKVWQRQEELEQAGAQTAKDLTFEKTRTARLQRELKESMDTLFKVQNKDIPELKRENQKKSMELSQYRAKAKKWESQAKTYLEMIVKLQGAPGEAPPITDRHRKYFIITPRPQAAKKVQRCVWTDMDIRMGFHPDKRCGRDTMPTDTGTSTPRQPSMNQTPPGVAPSPYPPPPSPYRDGRLNNPR